MYRKPVDSCRLWFSRMGEGGDASASNLAVKRNDSESDTF